MGKEEIKKYGYAKREKALVDIGGFQKQESNMVDTDIYLKI
jgi:hypothetical protein